MKHSFKLRPLCAVIALISAFSLLLSSCGGSKDPASSTGSDASGDSVSNTTGDLPGDSSFGDSSNTTTSTNSSTSGTTSGTILKPNSRPSSTASTTQKPPTTQQTLRNDYKIDTPQEKKFASLKGTTIRLALDPETLVEGSQDKVMLDYCQKKYGVKYEYLGMGYEELRTKIGQMVAAGNPPDYVLMYESNFLQWAYRNILQPIDKYLVDDSTWTGVSRTYFKTNNRTYGITYGNPDTDLYTYMIFYNKTLFEEQKVQDPYELYQKGQWTMDKLVETAKKMTLYREDGKTIKTYGFSTWAPTYFILANGGYGIRETKPGKFESTLKEKADLGGLDVFYRMVQDKSFGMGLDPYVGFGNRTIAMHFEIPGNAIYQYDYYNTMDDEIGMVPMPMADDGKYYAIVMEYGFGVPRNAKNPLGGVMLGYENYQLNNGRLVNNPSKYDLEIRRKTLSDEHLKIMQDYYKKATIRTNWMEGLTNWQEGGLSKKFWDKITVDKLTPTAAVDSMDGILKSAIKQTIG